MPKTIPQDWISIPYGKALKNQAYRVVDELGRNCPNYVMGELLIGGVGVAKGYYGDRELTVKKFFKKDGIRWYKTGDNGRTWDDGTIEFLGRKDTQVKIKGHRIELGEIEDAILGEIKRPLSNVGARMYLTPTFIIEPIKIDYIWVGSFFLYRKPQFR